MAEHRDNFQRTAQVFHDLFVHSLWCLKSILESKSNSAQVVVEEWFYTLSVKAKLTFDTHTP